MCLDKDEGKLVNCEHRRVAERDENTCLSTGSYPFENGEERGDMLKA